MSKLIIIRGLPGSGKSTLAASKYSIHRESDSYFIRPDGTYDFNPKLLNKAHTWCYEEVCFHLRDAFLIDVIVSNTFTQWWEMEPYIKFCKDNGFKVEVITLTTQYGNIHNVPEETMKKMAERFESHEDIMKKVNEVMG